MHPHRPSVFKPCGWALTGLADASLGAPAGPMVTLPVNHRSFEANVLAGLFGLNPFVAQDLFAFGEEFGVKR